MCTAGNNSNNSNNSNNDTLYQLLTVQNRFGTSALYFN